MNEFRHAIAIRAASPNPTGTRVAVVDTSGTLFVYSPLSDSMVVVDDPQNHIKAVLWDFVDPNCFLSHDGATCLVYFYLHNYVGGSKVRKLGETYAITAGKALAPEPGSDVQQLPNDSRALMLYDGYVVLLSGSSGGLESFRIRTHNSLIPLDKQSLEKAFYQNIALGRMDVAYNFASQIGEKKLWKMLGQTALRSMDIGTEKKAYNRLATDPGMVFTLNELAGIEGKQELSGHIHQLTGQFRKAQETWLQGGYYGQEALVMNMDLMVGCGRRNSFTEGA